MAKVAGNRPPQKKRETISVVGYSLLSLLARKQRTGYELSRFTVGARSMIFSSSGHSNIYKELAKLSAHELVTFHVVKDARPFDKKLYTMTELGREKLLHWVKTKPQRIERTEMSIRLHAIWLLNPIEAQALIEEQIALAEHELRELEAHQSYLQKENDIEFPLPQNPLFGTFANIGLEIEYRKVLIKWHVWIREQLIVSPAAPRRLFSI